MNKLGCAILGLGYLGRPLAEALYQGGVSVAAVKKRLTSDDVNVPIDLQFADLDDVEAAEQVYAGWQDKAVWVALLPPSAVADYVAVITQWVRAAQRYAVPHLVFASSISVYGSQTRVCDENSELAPETVGAQAIMAAEQVVLKSGMANIDVVRLGGLYSSTRHPLNRLLQRSVVEGAEQAVNMLHQDRAVSVLLRAIQTPSGRRIRNGVETAHPSKQDFYTAEAMKLGLPCPQFIAGGNTGKVVTTCYNDFFDILC